MATILAGAGNTSPYARGAAWGSYLTSSNFANLLPDADSVYRKFTISAQNHSYGTAIENYYGGDAAAFDQSSRNLSSLLHVFSAGNIGNTAPATGYYAGMQGYANISGSFKMSKNSITVGATDSFNQVAVLSSKGPAYDGRVKPELVAFGEDGSSGAAALVSGSVALIQQAYKISMNASLPSNALVKAALLNSADDIERPNVDYASGYGALNTYGAVKTILEKRFREDAVMQGEIKTVSVFIPQGVAKAKFTVTWTDPPAVPNAAKALVNDIDMDVQLPSTAETWLPWVLNPTNKLDSVLLPAKRGRDTLNPTEQITIENPVSGNYLVRIAGANIPSGAIQAFAVTYQFDSTNFFQWTFPTATDALQAQKTNVIRWQTSIRDTASLDYSLNGVLWQTIATGINLQNQYYKWKTPDTTATFFLRMRINGQTTPFVLDSFTVSIPLQQKVGFNCPDSFMLFWNKLPVAQYQVYGLGQKYLQPLLRTTDSFAVLQKNQFTSLYYSVAPVINNKVGLKSFTSNYTTQGVGCFVSTFLVDLVNNKAVLQAQLGSVYGINAIQVIRRNSSGKTVVKTFAPPLPTTFFLEDSNLAIGVNTYQLGLVLSNGQIVYSNMESVYYFSTQTVILYPNPAAQNQPIQIITQSPGKYTIVVYDANGRKITTRVLEDVSQQLLLLRLAKGFYFVSISADNKKSFTQKLVVY